MSEKETKSEILDSKINDKKIMSYEVAEAELEKWFDYRKTKTHKRKNVSELTGQDSQREELIYAFIHGQLKFNPDNGILTQILEFPVMSNSGDTVMLAKLDFKPRVRKEEQKKAMVGIKPTDVSGTMASYVSAATNVPTSLIEKMDTADRSITDIISNFFS